MNRIKQFIQTSGIYFIGNILSKMIAFFLLPLYTSSFSPYHFGIYDLEITIISFVVPVLFFQVWDALFRFAFDKDKFIEKYNIVSNSLFSFLLSLLIYTLIFWVTFKNFNFSFPLLIYLYGLMIALQYQYTFIARAFLKNKLFVFSGFVNSLFNAILNIVLILFFDFGIESLYISAIVGCFVQVLMIELDIKPIRHFKVSSISIALIIDMLKFSIPLCIATVSYWLLSGYTKVIITQQLGAHENGMYAVANRFSFTISLFVSVFQFAWNEVAYSMSNDVNRIFKYKKSIEYLMKVVLLGSALIILIVKIIFPYLIDISYQDSLLILPLSLVGIAFNSLAGFIGTIFMTEKSTKVITYTTIVSALMNILLLWIFTPIWGLQGAIGALCLSFMGLSLLRIYLIQKRFDFKFPKIIISAFFAVLAATLYVFFNVTNLILLVMFIIIISCLLVYSLREILFLCWKSIRRRS